MTPLSPSFITFVSTSFYPTENKQNILYFDFKKLSTALRKDIDNISIYYRR